MLSLLPASAMLTAVYIPPHVDVKNAPDVIYTTTNTLETKFPEVLFIVASDLNQANLKRALPKYHQHISCPTRGPEHPGPLLHNRQRHLLLHPPSTLRKIRSQHCVPPPSSQAEAEMGGPLMKRSEAVEDYFWDCLESVDWTVFKCSLENLDKYATTITDFISKCVEDCVPKKSTRNTTGVPTPAPTTPDTPVPSVTASEIRSIFLGVNPRKAMGSDSVPSQALRSCVDQLVEVFTDIFTLPILRAKVPTCFKKTTIISARKKLQKVACTPQTIMEANLPSMDSIYMAHCCRKAVNIIKDPSHP
eukprot:g30944.t1